MPRRSLPKRIAWTLRDYAKRVWDHAAENNVLFLAGGIAFNILLAADGSRPLLSRLVTGLPVAGFTGTLSLRFGAGGPRAAAGLVRAKTGTLTGVSTLAGVTSFGGHPVAFVVMADAVPGDTLAARQALDRFAAVIARS